MSCDFWGTGKSPSSVFPGESFRLERGDAFQRGMDKRKAFFASGLKGFKLYIHGRKEITWSCCISKLHIVCPAFLDWRHCHWLWQEVLFLFSDYIGRSGICRAHSLAQRIHWCLLWAASIHKGVKITPSIWLTWALKTSKQYLQLIFEVIHELIEAYFSQVLLWVEYDVYCH